MSSDSESLFNMTISLQCFVSEHLDKSVYRRSEFLRQPFGSTGVRPMLGFSVAVGWGQTAAELRPSVSVDWATARLDISRYKYNSRPTGLSSFSARVYACGKPSDLAVLLRVLRTQHAGHDRSIQFPIARCTNHYSNINLKLR